jgi:hypothetical protein
MAETTAPQASLVQDVWLGTDPRLRGRRLAPFEAVPVRILIQADLGSSLDDASLSAFLEALAVATDVVAFEPRGEGASGGRFGPEVPEDFRSLVENAPRRWHDDLPLVVAGIGFGAAMALAVADHAAVTGVVAVAPVLPPVSGRPDVDALLRSLELPRRIEALRRPLLVLDPREDPATNHEALAAIASHPCATLVAAPVDRPGLLAPPWPAIVGAWAAWVAACRPPAGP